MNNPEGIKALVALVREFAAIDEVWRNPHHDALRQRANAAIESLTAVAEPEEESRAITALKVTLFETECYLPASIAKRVQAACAVGVAGDAEVPANFQLGETIYTPPGEEVRFCYTRGQPNNVNAWRLGEACRKAADASAGDYIDRGLVLLKELEAKGYGVFRFVKDAAPARQAFETMPAPAPDCDTRHAVTFYFNDKAAAEQFPTRQAVEGMVLGPRVPTRAMADAGRYALATMPPGASDEEKAVGIYASMIRYANMDWREYERSVIVPRYAAAPQAGKGVDRG